MVKHRVLFEPIDVDDFKIFEHIYNELKLKINSEKGFELMPSIRKIYPIDEHGFPINTVR